MFGNSSPFTTKQSKPITDTIPQETEIIFVSDMFIEDYVGGAELTSEALISSAPFNVFKIHTRDLSMKLLESGHRKYWIFGNFASMDHELIPAIVANLNYSIVEYDYKYCKWRSPEKHKVAAASDCDCANDMHGKMVSAFMHGAKSLWWMSEEQMIHYHTTYPFLSEKENWVLSSVFDESFFISLRLLREKYKNCERKGWVVLGSTSWIKGYEEATAWCEQNDKEYESVFNQPYNEVLEKLAQAEGFVYLPRGGDTCPRMVIEAKLLGCKLQLNNNVQHSQELWFDTDDMLEVESYLYAARERFWNGIKYAMEWSPMISGYTTVLNAIQQHYPWEACIESMLAFCDEVVVVDGGSQDGTWEKLLEWAENDNKLKPFQHERNWNDVRHAVYDGAQKAEARKLCSGDICWQQDADEILHEEDHEKIKALIRAFPSQIDLISLPVIEYWGGPEKIRLDVTPWKWRLSRNKPYITHGIPMDLRKIDEAGNLYALPGTDGCDYVHNETGDVIPHVGFYNSDAHDLRLEALGGDEEALKTYQEWFSRNLEAFPAVHHYSWFNLGRKIRLYRDYWSKHWQSLYNIVQEDIPENNMFFQKSWSDVAEEEIDQLANDLKEKMGGWVFHERVNFENPTPHMTLSVSHPKFITGFIDG